MAETSLVVAVIIGIVQAFKMAGVNSRYAPIISLVLGILFFGVTKGITPESLFDGIIAGLSASGLFSGLKTQIK